MRLIDADRLLNPGYTDMFDEPIKLDVFTRYAIETEPTVEAIPVEWLRIWFTKKASLIGITLMGEIESDWEAENGNNNNNTK